VINPPASKGAGIFLLIKIMIEYSINAQFQKDVEAVMQSPKFTEFKLMRELEVRIMPVICTHTNNDDEHVQGKGSPMSCKKLSPLYQLLTDHHYILIGDYYFWTHADERRRDAAIHSALYSINVERSKAGAIKLKTRKPDINEHSATITRFGAYTEPLENCLEAFKQSAKLFASSVVSSD
jgi:hypothetical protein